VVYDSASKKLSLSVVFGIILEYTGLSLEIERNNETGENRREKISKTFTV
jgi:hypothetical protein